MCRRLREPSRWARRRKRECEGSIARTVASSISPAQTHPRPAVPSPQRRPVCAGRDSGPGRTGRGAADGLSSKQGCRDAALSGVSPLGSRRLGDRLAPAPARAQQAQRGRSAGRFCSPGRRGRACVAVAKRRAPSPQARQRGMRGTGESSGGSDGESGYQSERSKEKSERQSPASRFLHPPTRSRPSSHPSLRPLLSGPSESDAPATLPSTLPPRRRRPRACRTSSYVAPPCASAASTRCDRAPACLLLLV